jgi:putative SOS response-associated peptidase YedK
MLIRFGAMDEPSFETFDEKRIVPRYNIAPSQPIPVARLNKSGERVIRMVSWGLVPSWTKGTPKSRPINARAETIATSGMFRQAYERRRCLIPADGFYEWQGKTPPKQPMFIHQPDDGMFAFAGLWERWKPDDAHEPVDTCTIITTTPNAVMKPIHDRMPVILHERDYDRWLSRDVSGGAVMDLLRPFDGELEAYPVSTQVNKPANDSVALIERIA